MVRNGQGDTVPNPSGSVPMRASSDTEGRRFNTDLKNVANKGPATDRGSGFSRMDEETVATGTWR